MTQDEIIEMARQAGIKRRTDEFYSEFCDGVYFDDLEAFAKLVAAHGIKETSMTDKDAMKLALFALDIVKIHYTQSRHINEAITALKERLTQPPQRTEEKNT